MYQGEVGSPLVMAGTGVNAIRAGGEREPTASPGASAPETMIGSVWGESKRHPSTALRRVLLVG